MMFEAVHAVSWFTHSYAVSHDVRIDSSITGHDCIVEQKSNEETRVENKLPFQKDLQGIGWMKYRFHFSFNNAKNTKNDCVHISQLISIYQ